MYERNLLISKKNTLVVSNTCCSNTYEIIMLCYLAFDMVDKFPRYNDFPEVFDEVGIGLQLSDEEKPNCLPEHTNI